MPQEKWIILESGHDEPVYWVTEFQSEERKPKLWDTQMDAFMEMVDDYIALMQDQKDQVERGERDMDEMCLECNEYVVPCTVHEDGVIVIESGEIYNPKTYK